MLNKMNDNSSSNKNKPKGKISLPAKLLAGALALTGTLGAAKLTADNMAKMVPTDSHKTDLVATHNNDGQKPLSPGIEMPKVYVPQVPRTNGLDAFDEVHKDKSQNWAAVDHATANKPAKPSTAKRSD
jgi:hypothetical protein